MFQRLFDLAFATCLSILAVPLILCGALAVKLSSAGPVFYPARRVGRDGRTFTMYKIRTMHQRSVAGSSITAANDARIFAAGRILRALKIDELPQLMNIFAGDMSVVGPRPEAPDIVENHYTQEYWRSLTVRPGLTSPGSVFYYTHGEELLPDGAAEDVYVQRLLPPKMKIDLDYLKRRTLFSDFAVVVQTGVVLIQKALGRKQFPLPKSLTGFFVKPDQAAEPKSTSPAPSKQAA